MATPNPNIAKVECRLSYFVAAYAHEIAADLDNAGLIVTPHHEQALEACQGYAEDHDTHWGSYRMTPPAQIVYNVGCASLAAKKPKERWEAVLQTVSGAYLVRDRLNVNTSFGGLTEQQARTVAAALNALEVKS